MSNSNRSPHLSSSWGKNSRDRKTQTRDEDMEKNSRDTKTQTRDEDLEKNSRDRKT
jgi:hypothetical protein